MTRKIAFMANGTWFYAYEALVHLHSLRLILRRSDAAFSPLQQCLQLKACLNRSPGLSEPSILCSWLTFAGNSCCVIVPLPLCLLDHSVPVQARAHADHIEVKLQLLRCKDSVGGLQPLFGLFLERQTEDAYELIEVGDALYCKNCSTRITRFPFRKVQELPSVDWRELADHWYGSCCCSSTIRTEDLLSRFASQSAPSEGACLVGQTTFYVPRENLLTESTFDAPASSLCNDETAYGVLSWNSEPESVGVQINGSSLVSVYDSSTLTSLPIAESKECLLHADANLIDVCNLKSEKIRENQVLSPCQQSMDWTNEQLDRACIHHERLASEDVSVVGAIIESSSKHLHCNSHWNEHECLEGHHLRGRNEMDGQEFNIQVSGSKLEHLDRLIKGPTGFSYLGEWRSYKCHFCSALLGAYTKITSDDLEEGVHFYKRHILTKKVAGNLSDAFRKHTLQRDIAFELKSKLEVNASYRFLVRGLNLKKPFLQLIVVNDDSWLCVGRCEESLDWENELVASHSDLSQQCEDGSVNCDLMECKASAKNSSYFERKRGGCLKQSDMLATFKPAMKVNFCDCRDFTEEELSHVEDWGKECQADDMFVLEEEVPLLIEHLLENQRFCPPAFSIFKNFSISFLLK